MFREMQRKKQQLSPEECAAVLREAKRGVLSLTGDDGYPYGVPLNHWYSEEDGRLYFHSGKTGHKIDAMRRSDKASFCVTDGGVQYPGEWWLTFRSVIVFGRILPVTDPEEALRVSRELSLKFTSDTRYIEEEIVRSGPGVFCFALVPEHVSGKLVREK